MARELLDDPPPALPPADVFALGAAAFEMMRARALPSRGPQWHALREGKLEFPPLPTGYAQDSPLTAAVLSLQGLIRGMMHPEGRRRPTAKQAEVIALRL